MNAEKSMKFLAQGRSNFILGGIVLMMKAVSGSAEKKNLTQIPASCMISFSRNP